MTRPLTIGPGGLFFLPQRPYLTSGTLRQQLLYPEVEQRVSDAELVQVRECGVRHSRGGVMYTHACIEYVGVLVSMVHGVAYLGSCCAT